jgi:hypothetical protein
MNTETAKMVDFKRLAAALGDYRFAYLLTVDDQYRVHSVTVTPDLAEDAFDIGPIGNRTRRNVERHSAVTLLWPPTAPGGYSLIVDGAAAVADSDDAAARLRIVPTRALLHRNADPETSGLAQGGLHDCVVLTEKQ